WSSDASVASRTSDASPRATTSLPEISSPPCASSRRSPIGYDLIESEPYTTSQGSRLMPYDWFKALRRVDADESFGADQLKRYGSLPNERATNGWPVGFVVDTRATPGQLGMTCAACHTGQIEYQKNGSTVRMRIDGAPAAADFQMFLTELAAAARLTSTS